MLKKLFIAAASCAMLFTVTSCQSDPAKADFNIIPIPMEITAVEGEAFIMDANTPICYPAGNAQLKRNAEFLSQYVEQITGHKLQCIEGESNNAIILSEGLDNKNPEAYKLSVSADGITIQGASAAGAFYGVQTLRKSLPISKKESIIIPATEINDAPRFAYRGAHLDVSRHFVNSDSVRRFIDILALHNINRFHWHLTDDQGWRIEIKSHPKLTQTGAFRNKKGGNNGPDNGFYTQEQMKELIQYASERYIEIVPELDIPGHSVAILAAYPQLGCSFRQSEEKNLGSTTNMMLCASCNDVYTVYEDIIREVASIFPSKYIHLGGDEAAVKANWAKCDDCLATMHKAGYNEPSQLMNIFFGKMLDIVKRNKKEAILWCELDNIWPPANDYLFPYPTDVTLVTWRNGLTPKCIELTRKHGNNLIMAPGEYTYLDYPQWKNDLPEYNNWGMPVTTLETCYKFDPGYGLSPEESSHITGVMATLWAEAIKDINRVNYMFFPRGLAIAEAAWSTMEQRSWESFKERLQPNLSDLMKCGVSYRVPFEIYERK